MTPDFLHASDVVEVLIKALTKGGPGIYNRGSGRASSIASLAVTIEKIFPERNVSIKPPGPDGKIPESFSALNISKAKRMWGFRPALLEEGLRRWKKQMENSLCEVSRCSS